MDGIWWALFLNGVLDFGSSSPLSAQHLQSGWGIFARSPARLRWRGDSPGALRHLSGGNAAAAGLCQGGWWLAAPQEED